MNDQAAAAAMQAAARKLKEQFPGRGFCLFIWPGTPDERVHYVSNAARSAVVTAMKDFIARGAVQALPEDPQLN